MQYNTGIAMQTIQHKKGGAIQYWLETLINLQKWYINIFFLVKMWVGVSSLILRKLMIAGSL